MEVVFDIGSGSHGHATMYAYFVPHNITLYPLIDKVIVNVIIGNTTFHPNDMGGVSWAHILRTFVATFNSLEDVTDAGDSSRYEIIIINIKHFMLIAQYLAYGISLRQVAQVIVVIKYLLMIGIIGLYSEGTVSHYYSFIYELNL